MDFNRHIKAPEPPPHHQPAVQRPTACTLNDLLVCYPPDYMTISLQLFAPTLLKSKEIK